jgi:lipopolysaccharide export system permease protein
MGSPWIKRIDRYILGKYFRTFFFTALMFTIISIAIDVSENISYFLDKPVTLKQILVDYYLSFIPYINLLLWPLFVLISVIFFTSRMANDTEFIAITGAGVPLFRWMVPYMMGASAIVVMMLLGNHILVPKANEKRINIINTYFKPEKTQVNSRDIHLFIDEDTKIFARYYRKGDTSVADLWIEHFKNNEVAEVLKAKSAKYDGNRGIWTLRGYTLHKFDGLEESYKVEDSKPLDTLLQLYPEDFASVVNQKDMMTTAQINTFIDKERKKGSRGVNEYLIEKYRRTSDAFSIFLLTLLGASLSSKKIRGGMGLNLAIGLSLGAINILLSKISITFAATDSIPILLGVWIPNLVFLPIALFASWRAQH